MENNKDILIIRLNDIKNQIIRIKRTITFNIWSERETTKEDLIFISKKLSDVIISINKIIKEK